MIWMSKFSEHFITYAISVDSLQVKLNFKWQHWQELIFEFKLYFINLFSLNSASGLGELKCGVFPFLNQIVRSANCVVRISSLSCSLFLPANSSCFSLSSLYLLKIFVSACLYSISGLGLLFHATFYRTYNQCLVTFALKALLMIDAHQRG